MHLCVVGACDFVCNEYVRTVRGIRVYVWAFAWAPAFPCMYARAFALSACVYVCVQVCVCFYPAAAVSISLCVYLCVRVHMCVAVLLHIPTRKPAAAVRIKLVRALVRVLVSVHECGCAITHTNMQASCSSVYPSLSTCWAKSRPSKHAATYKSYIKKGI